MSESERNRLEAILATEPDVVRFTSFVESYHNLTAKALELYAWAWENGFRSVMKVDDDTYLRVPQFLSFVHQQAPLFTIYSGQFIGGPKKPAQTDPDSKWFMYDQYPHDYWPLYANGPGLLLGAVGVQFIWKNKKISPSLTFA